MRSKYRLAFIALGVISPQIASAQPCGGMQDLGALGGDPAEATAISADGAVIVGWAYTSPASYSDHAFRWTAGSGMQDLGTLGGDRSQAIAVSADGSVVVGWARNAALETHAFRWTRASGIQDLGTLGGNYSAAIATSADGSVVVGTSKIATDYYFARAFRWTEASGMQFLGTFGGNYSAAVATSADGSVVVGTARNALGFNRAFRWTAAGGLQDLGTLGGNSSWALAVSGDGSVIVGYAATATGPRAFRWTAGSGMQDLGSLGGDGSRATAISADGSVIVGRAGIVTGNYYEHAFRWTTENGMQDLGTLGGNTSFASAVSADGSIIVGRADHSSYSRAFRWTAENGMQDLGTLGGNGSLAWAVSADGSVIVGRADHDYYIHAFRWGDSDGDAIPDDWECNGVPYVDSQGNPQRYILDANGDGVSDANWLKKDIFVEVDAMTERAPTGATLQRVIDAFDPPNRTLVPPTPGLSGALPNVTLHIQTDPGDLNLTLLNNGNYMNGPKGRGFSDFAFDKERFFGTPAERAHPDWEAISDAKRKVYRYCIFANTNPRESGGVAGVANADDFMVTLGESPPGRGPLFPDANGDPGGTEDIKAATFMHELGHSLGLLHGGGDSVNYKPNYYSVMNYLWQGPQEFHYTPWSLRYSESELPTLYEYALSESAGLGANDPGVVVPFNHSGLIQCWYTRCFNLLSGAFYCVNPAGMAAGAPVDWDGDCALTPGFVAADINDFSTATLPANATLPERVAAGQGLGELRGYHDWINLNYNFRTNPTYQPGTSGVQDLDCSFDVLVVDFLDSIPPFFCPSDWNQDGVFNTADFVAYLNDFNTALAGGDPTYASPDIREPIGTLNTADFVEYLNRFTTGCP